MDGLGKRYKFAVWVVLNFNRGYVDPLYDLE
jgi:hypothetical protein